ncbi:acetyl/propionyl/methylcrotonyl-CoA carboxylase subunit alpha [Comamonas aquatica]|jgi:propionyl-CoA carboxylase alpha chain|uniref:propionyl-CoA carboxylase n=1 Tax=Comamonas aquatica TaxID=225991 RepID=A0AA35D9C4_9BURK|nr:acetyl/propionyl/methylcrotonyl-CoA carboxylase subunit alpha [Comamonas aquatica]ANY62450.1 acetyl/propionyl-CoA carboxylase subuit alpha [Comamonas aquatica]MDE1555140.1 acetyl/propionyl/methylcrotonyl-CoA carboxylase subunit alpha [Comamonas aquatica]MDH0202465.1 acetyl/propionyl/methylcrotonyl-CoA carboxylase subunit alpha [Comamonas aquatica]MDH0495969.1 acetyl/propionyl/methylcrotonyl-CoA carboxylase subunit alpha [Comamonas aquatica]MDH1428635.1 acetyl/propionyl/methylcrotonyl-CoA ca
MFTKILIANRGEIACRVIATAQKMGIATVAVYSDADKEARHVKLADEAVHIGAAPSRESYLVADRIIAAAKQTGAQAIHPGYGFLSENEAFAKRCEDEGIAFIGPKAHSIAAMGDKIASKKLANEAQVNTIPGYNDPIAGPEQAVEIAKGIGYPVMIKASAGGGGKGLRVAFNDKEAFEGFASCQNEARNSFGDDRIFIEKFVEQPRHIEIQILGDSHGNVIYLNERECSIQRRHQKVIEEAPSPFISDATRKAMGEQAVALAKAVQYQSAGTVEFVVGKNQDFYFLEMNTRLQVEHPVTECITGLDLVEQMIRVAAGEALTIRQEDVKRDGWAMECRINAEDPFRNFLPSTGRLVRFNPPEQSMWQGDTAHLHGVRVDTGVYEGGEIPMFYDSMIAKLIVHGKDRAEAIAKMREALNGFVIRGISSNIPFQAALLAHPKFQSGDFNTGFIAEHYAHGFNSSDVPHSDPDFLVALAAHMNRRYRARASTISGQMRGHEVVVSADYTVVVLGAEGQNQHHPVTVSDFEYDSRKSTVTLNGKRYEFQSFSAMRELRLQGSCNGQPFTVQVERGTPKNPLALRITHNGTQIDAMVLSPRGAQLHQLMPYKAPPDLSKFLLSPMPGLLVDVAVQVGQKVQAGEKLAVIEAMKMENILFATQDGVVSKVSAGKGDSLAVDDVILEFE